MNSIGAGKIMVALGNKTGQENTLERRAKPFTVLVVDDEEHIISFIRIKLRLSGYAIVSARNTFEALCILKNQHVDAAVIDLMMPGTSGLNLIEQMRTFTRIPVIMLTAMDCPETKYSALSTGADDFLTKPFNPDDIVARIEKIRQRRSSDIFPG